MTATKTARKLTEEGVALVRHPIVTASYAAGLVTGTVRGAARVVGHLAEAIVHAEPLEEAEAPEQRAPVGERTRYGGLHTEPAPPMTPGGGGEPLEHEPKAESRDVAHGDAPAQPREVASWDREAADAELEPGVEPGIEPGIEAGIEAGTDDEPLLDPATAKAVRSESEILRRAADPEKG